MKWSKMLQKTAVSVQFVHHHFENGSILQPMRAERRDRQTCCGLPVKGLVESSHSECDAVDHRSAGSRLPERKLAVAVVSTSKAAKWLRTESIAFRILKELLLLVAKVGECHYESETKNLSHAQNHG